MQFSCPFVLASGSPRRKALLEQLGMQFEICVSDADESFDPSWTPPEIVRDLAKRKAQTVALTSPEALILAADTVVSLNGEILNKPADSAEAAEMLRSLSGKRHTVYSGIALDHPATDRLQTAAEATDVIFAPMTETEILSYVATGSPLDKAGAYGIQDDRGALYISRVEGDYYNVVGLPLHRLYRMIITHFDDLLVS